MFKIYGWPFHYVIPKVARITFQNVTWDFWKIYLIKNYEHSERSLRFLRKMNLHIAHKAFVGTNPNEGLLKNRLPSVSISLPVLLISRKKNVFYCATINVKNLTKALSPVCAVHSLRCKHFFYLSISLLIQKLLDFWRSVSPSRTNGVTSSSNKNSISSHTFISQQQRQLEIQVTVGRFVLYKFKESVFYTRE